MLARGIHASRHPAAREQILRGELHRPTCTACGTTIEIDHDLVYTDFHRYHWVRVAKPIDLAAWARIEGEMLAQFDRVFHHTAPVMAENVARFRVRLVFDLDELRERLAIWNTDLDDGVVECCKLACMYERVELTAPGRRIRLREIAANGDLAFASVHVLTPTADIARWIMPAEAVARVASERADWQSRNSELFDRGFVSLDRYLAGAITSGRASG